jgi:hypothetical protein
MDAEAEGVYLVEVREGRWRLPEARFRTNVSDTATTPFSLSETSHSNNEFNLSLFTFSKVSRNCSSLAAIVPRTNLFRIDNKLQATHNYPLEKLVSPY